MFCMLWHPFIFKQGTKGSSPDSSSVYFLHKLRTLHSLQALIEKLFYSWEPFVTSKRLLIREKTKKREKKNPKESQTGSGGSNNKTSHTAKLYQAKTSPVTLLQHSQAQRRRQTQQVMSEWAEKPKHWPPPSQIIILEMSWYECNWIILQHMAHAWICNIFTITEILIWTQTHSLCVLCEMVKITGDIEIAGASVFSEELLLQEY